MKGCPPDEDHVSLALPSGILLGNPEKNQTPEQLQSEPSTAVARCNTTEIFEDSSDSGWYNIN